MKFQRLRGTDDILGSQARLWQKIEKVSHNLFSSFGYQEIRTPIIEPLKLFERSIGETTQIVEKELFQFQDRSGRDICLRPEATASIARAYIENRLFQKAGLTKLYYLGAMFRAERPQKGRKRQFHQVGIEAIGSSQPELDAEVIYLAKLFLDKLELKDYLIQINTLGCREDKKEILAYLAERLKDNLEGFCSDCKQRFSRNPFRILDCKNSSCRENLEKLNINFQEAICKECLQHYQEVKELLSHLKVEYSEERRLVRGLDYYTRTVFEVSGSGLGAQNAVGAGGRYDNLIEEMGGPAVGAIGFAFGLERIALLLGEEEEELSPLDVFLVLQNREYLKLALSTVMKLRQEGLYVEMDYQGRSLKSQMRLANERNARIVLILGREEFEMGGFSLKYMESGKQIWVSKEDLISTLKGD